LKTGVILGMSFEEYRAIDAINVSGLKRIKQSPLHYWADYLAPNRIEKEQTPSMYRGTAIHTAVLEPERFSKEYKLEPRPEDYPKHLHIVDDLKNELRKASLPLGGAKAELITRLRENNSELTFFEDIQKEHEKYKLLKRDDWEACQKITEGVRKNPALSVLFESGNAEVTLIWKDEYSGVMCKARADWLTKDGVIVDIKSAIDASIQEFSWAFERYGYWQQAAWYLDGVKATTGIEGTFLLVAFEPSFPFATAIYTPDEQSLIDGKNENRFMFNKYIECRKEKHWPGYSDEIQTIKRPIFREKKGT